MSDDDAQLVEERFARTEPGGRGRHLLHVLMLAMVCLMLLLPLLRTFRQAEPQGPADEPPTSRLDRIEVGSVLLMGGMICTLLLMGWSAGRRQRSCRKQVLEAWGHVQLDEWTAARAALDEVMASPIRSPSDRGQAFTMLAAVAEHEGRYEVAARIYETLLLRRIGDPVCLQQAQIALAAAKIRNQELTDAIDFLGRLEKVPMPAGLRAALDLVRLFQQVFMGHYDDAVEGWEERRMGYRRHLSTHAGYAYGLLAAAMHHLGRREEAARFWGEATTLIKADKLIREYAMLAAVSQAYPATEHRL